MAVHVVDGDTIVTEDDKVRVGFINTPESVHQVKEYNTPEGDEASEFAKAILPPTSELTTTKVDNDKYGRTVSSVTRNIQGVDIDYGLVALDQEMSEYYTQYGEHPNPMLHDAYKEYYHKDMPYQFGTTEEPLSDEEFSNMTRLNEEFTDTFTKFKEGKASQDELDTATVNLYGDATMVKRYRHQLSDWNRPIEQESDYTLRGAMRLAMEADPNLKAEYNKSVRTGHLTQRPIPEADPSFWSNASTSFSMFGSVSNFMDFDRLWESRKNGGDLEVPEGEFTAGLPEQYHAMILAEADKWNDESALMLRDQLIQDLANEAQFDDMGFFAQFGYGALAFVADPLTLLPAGKLAQGGQAIVKSNRAWQMSRAIAGKAPLAHSDTVAKLTAWTVIGGTEGLIINTPRLAADHTYNAKDYMLDSIYDAGFGLGIGGLATGFKPIKNVFSDYMTKVRDSKVKEQEHIHNLVEIRDKPPTPATPELEQVGVQAAKAANENIVKTKVANLTNTEFVPFTHITEVSKDGFTMAMDTLVNTYPAKSYMNVTMRRLKKLNNSTTLTPEETKLVNKLNADVLHIAAAFPDGKVPKDVESNLAKAIFRQKSVETVHALERVATGKTSSPVEDLIGWRNSLKNNKSLWKEGVEPTPMSRDEFFREYSDLVSSKVDVTTGEEFTNLTQYLPKEMSMLKDLIEINKLADGHIDKRFREVVEDLNGMFNERMRQMNVGAKDYPLGGTPETTQYADSSKSFGKTRLRTPQEVINQLKKEGLTESNPEYVARRKELVDMSRDRVSKNILQTLKNEELPVGTKMYDKRLRALQTQEIANTLRHEGLTPRTHAYTTRFNQLKREAIEVTQEVNAVGKQDIYRAGEERVEFDKDFDLEQDLAKPVDTNVTTTHNEVNTTARLESDRGDVSFVKGDQLVEHFTEDFDQGLLPTSFNKSKLEDAFNNPDLETLAGIRKSLDRNIIKPMGLKDISGKKESIETVERLNKVKAVLVSKKQEVLDRMVAAGKWSNLEDVIRVQHTLANERKLAAANASKTDNITTGEHTASFDDNPLKEQDFEVLADNNRGVLTEKVTEEEFTSIKKRASDSYDKMVEESGKKVSSIILDTIVKGELEAYQLALKPTGTLDYAGRMAGKITEDLASKFNNSELDSLQFVGARVTEMGRGYGGNIRRKATGGIIRDGAYKESIVKILPQYSRMIDSYAASKGKSAVGRMNAQQMAGADNKIVKQFNRDVFKVQEYRRQGRELPSGMNKSVLDFVKQWDLYMDHNHNTLVEAGIGGFTKERKVKNYIPHIWKPQNLNSLIKKHGEDKIIELLRRGYESAIKNGTNSSSLGSAKDLAVRQVKWIKEQGEGSLTAIDQFLPVKDSRAKQRLDIDTTIEMDGIAILDLLDDEVAGLATKYSNRLAGWVGLAESTDGAITSQLDIDTLKNIIIQEGKDKNIDTKTYEKYYDDMINLMFGRPTRDGLTQELRQFKDLTALTRMGGLGTAQLIETAQVITRSVLNTFSSEPVAKKLFAMSKGRTKDDLMREIQSISNLTDDIEWLDRQSVHLDQHELAEVNKMRQFSLWLADTATGGKYKAPASRLLGKTTGYNAIRRTQSRIAQASFTIDVAKHFKNGNGKMSVKRMADLGLTDTYGADADLQKVFNTLVEYGEDGLVSKLNVDKWPKEARKKFQYAILRDEAQQIQRTHVGEMPPWMNNPLIALALQFRQMPIVANNKQLGRSMAFADKEAVVATMLNTAIAGLVRYSKFGLLGAGVAAITGEDIEDPSSEKMQVSKYITSLGIFPDAVDLVLDSVELARSDSQDAFRSNASEVMGHVPVMGLANDYMNLAIGDSKEQVDAAFGLMPLGNTAYGDMIHTWVQETFNND